MSTSSQAQVQLMTPKTKLAASQSCTDTYGDLILFITTSPFNFSIDNFSLPKKEKVENLISRSEKRTTQKKGTITLDSKY